MDFRTHKMKARNSGCQGHFDSKDELWISTNWRVRRRQKWRKRRFNWAPASGQHCDWVFTWDPVESLWGCWTVDPYFHPHFVDKEIEAYKRSGISYAGRNVSKPGSKPGSRKAEKWYWKETYPASQFVGLGCEVFGVWTFHKNKEQSPDRGKGQWHFWLLSWVIHLEKQLKQNKQNPKQKNPNAKKGKKKKTILCQREKSLNLRQKKPWFSKYLF